MKIRAGLLPFLPLIVGITLKFFLVDAPCQEDNCRTLSEQFKEDYLRGLWVQLVVTAYIIGTVWAMTRESTNEIGHDAVIYLFIVPAVAFFACLVLSIGFARHGITSEVFTIYLPAFVGALSLGVSGSFVGK